MTRPGGKTAKGLRYPGNDITVDTIPDAIRNLATDIDAALGKAGASQVQVQQINTAVSLAAYGQETPVAFTQLAAVSGCVANWGQDNFSAGLILAYWGNVVKVRAVLTAGLRIGTPTAAPNPPGQSNFRLTGTQIYSPQYVSDGRWVGVNLIAWGPKA